jgi:triacylglycerol esterase/lipase EstA (alpha/beta hydrolase family)
MRSKKQDVTLIDQLADLSHEILKRKNEILKHREHLLSAFETTHTDLVNDLAQIKKSPKKHEVFSFLRNLSANSAWISNLSFKIFKSSLGWHKPLSEDVENNRKYQYILEKVQNSEPIFKRNISDDEIFKAIFLDKELSHFKTEYKARTHFTKTDSTIVLIDGVFNELYTVKVFQKGLDKLLQKYGQKYFVAHVSGIDGSEHNAKQLKATLEEYVANHPDEKLWLLAFSKGGVDALHFLNRNVSFANRHISGLSTIASPIIGSHHLDHKGIRFLNAIQELTDKKVSRYIGMNRDIILKELQRSLDAKIQEKWFRDNYKKLPSKLFYTATALNAKWYESHIWMIVTKSFFQSDKINDGVVDMDRALYPDYFNGINLGAIRGHHLIGTRSSSYDQEALLKAHIIFLKYKRLLS